MKLKELASVIRSKNAGPFMLTLDVMFESKDTYNQVIQSNRITADLISQLYQVATENIKIIHYPPSSAIKISMPRAKPSGDVEDTDVLGAQQHSPLLDIDIP